ncbi:hypothetical protein BN135_3569 [Cronobacter muytjensii 530]
MRRVGFHFAKERRGQFDIEFLTGVLPIEIAAEIPGGDRDNQPHDHQQADISAQQFAGGNRAWMRWHQRMHGGERAPGREGVFQRRATKTFRHAEDNRQHHHQTGVEENREAEQQRGDAQRERRAVFAKFIDKRVGQHFRPAGDLQHTAYHRAESHQQRDARERAAKTGQQRGHDFIKRHFGQQRHNDTDQGKSKKSMHFKAHDKYQQQHDGTGGNAQQRTGAISVSGFCHRYCPQHGYSETVAWSAVFSLIPVT